MNSVTVSATNVDDIIKSMVANLKGKPRPQYLLVPKTIRGEIDRKKYKGRGRPREEDYERLDMLKLLADVQRDNSNEENKSAQFLRK